MSWSDTDIVALLDENLPGYAVAVIGGESVPGLFRNAASESFGIAGSSPEFLLPGSTAASVADGDAITVDGVAYTVSGPPRLDGTGLARLFLQEAS